MGITFRKSFKIGKNTRINLSSKGGVGISTGVKGARVSVNKQGAKMYGGRGPVRFQKQLYSTPQKSNSIGTAQQIHKEIEQKEVKRMNILGFLKKHYKSIIAILVGFMIGGNLGSIGRVATSQVDEVKYQIESNAKSVDSKQAELESLLNKKSELEAIINE